MEKLQAGNVKYIIVHDVGSHHDMSAEDIRDLHSRRWPGTTQGGYHWVVRKDGDLERGRPEEFQGAHVKADEGKTRLTIPGLNAKSVGIVASGDSSVDDMPAAQRARLVDSVARLCIKYNVPHDNVKGHGEVEVKKNEKRDVSANSDFKESQMEKLRPLVRDRIAAIRRDEGPKPAPLKPGPFQERVHGASNPSEKNRPVLQATGPAGRPQPSTPPAGAAPAGPARAEAVVTGRFKDPLPESSVSAHHPFDVPTRGKTYNHRGIDFDVPIGTTVDAMDGGTVVRTGTDPSAGKFVVIQHGNTGFSSIYQHLSKIDVQRGHVVEQGQKIGESGRSGNVKPHLHVGITKGVTWTQTGWFNEISDYVDPAKLIDRGSYVEARSPSRQGAPSAPPAGARRPDAPPGATQPDATAPRDMLKVGMEGRDVVRLQHRLTGLGYGGRVGPVDGVFDARLAAAVKQFQADRGLPEKYQTGNAGPITRREMDAAVRENDRDGRAPTRPPASATPAAEPARPAPVSPSPANSAPASSVPAKPPAGSVVPPSGDGTRTAPPAPPVATSPGTATPGASAPASPSSDPAYATAAAAFLREADQAVSNILDRHVSDVPGALAALVRDTRGPGSGTLGATTSQDVQRSFARFTAGDATARPLSATEAGMVAGVLDERARLVGEGAAPSAATPGDGAGATPPTISPARPAVDAAPRL